MNGLIERTRLVAKILRDIDGQSAMAATVDEAAAALEAARENAEKYARPAGECPHRTRCDCLAGCKWGFADGGAK